MNAPPPKGWLLDCIRGGVLSGTFKFEAAQSRFVIGRGEESDIEVSGELVSRVHGVFHFMAPADTDEDGGFPFYMDNQSTHGTVLNKRMKGTTEGRLPPMHHVKLFSVSCCLTLGLLNVSLH